MRTSIISGSRARLAVAAFAAVAAHSALASVNVTVRNFDEDLATVYVNDVATTNGQVVAVDGEVKVELKDFRSDYYFRYAPASQADRTLGFESWEGLPDGVESQNPVSFTPTADVTIVPNVDVKGYAWQVVTDEQGKITSVTNHYHVWNWGSANDETRGVDFGKSITNTVGATENNLEIDFVERVRYKDRNYTITGIPGSHRPALKHTCAGLWAVAPRFSTFGSFISSGGPSADRTCITNIVGMYDLKTATIGQYCFYYSSMPLSGPATNFVPRKAKSIADNAYGGKKLTGELLLEEIESLNGKIAGITTARLTSEKLTTILNAFSGNTLKEITIASSVLTKATQRCIPTSVTNVIFLADAPSQDVLEAMFFGFADADGAHSLRLTVDPSRSNWWHRVSAPTANEVAAGLPENCLGSFVTENGRKAWIVSSSSTAGVLLVGDMSNSENLGCTTVSGLVSGQVLTLTVPDGMTTAWIQHMVNGTWTTVEEKELGSASSFTYTHGGELTRVQWRVDGATLTLTQSGHEGALAVEVKKGGLVVGDSIYEKGSEIWITATPQTTTHPYSRFAHWTVDGEEVAEPGEVLKIVMDGDRTVDASFDAAEWLYDESTKKATDGIWTTGARSGDIVDYGMTFGGFTSTDPSQWLDFSIPVYVPGDPDHEYRIMKVIGPSYWGGNSSAPYRVRFGADMVVAGFGLWSDGCIAELEGLGKTKSTVLGDYFLYNYGNATALRKQTYECLDFVPETLTKIAYPYTFQESPTLVGTLRLIAMNKMFSTLGGLNCGAITNLQLLAEDLQSLDQKIFRDFANIRQMTIGSTNLLSCLSDAFTTPASTVSDLTFLAHAPAATALDNILYYAESTNVVIHCSQFAPGWKAMRMKGYASQPEWAERPAGAWGLYETSDGCDAHGKNKRFYLVQRDSAYDHRDGMMIFVR